MPNGGYDQLRGTEWRTSTWCPTANVGAKLEEKREQVDR